MNNDKLKEILDKHKLWLNNNFNGIRANLSGADLFRENLFGADLSGADLSRANLSWADLSRADLSRANLSWADLSGANLSGANLSRANLSRANLSGADLSRANLSWADLSRANLSRANLSGADLSRANLSGANLSGANLSRANLSGANLSRANLSGADLSRANLSWADLSRADLSGADLSRANLFRANLSKKEWNNLKDRFTIVTLDTKYVYKKLCNNIIAYLEIPKKAKRSNAFSRKCRAEYIKVLKLIDANGNKVEKGYSLYNSSFEYKVGKIIRPLNKFDKNWFNECGSGIHFFLTEQEAKEFTL